MSQTIQIQAAKKWVVIALVIVAISTIAFGYVRGMLPIADALGRLFFLLGIPIRWIYKLLFDLPIQLPGATIESGDKKWRYIYAVLSISVYLFVIGSIYK